MSRCNRQVRAQARSGALSGPTCGLARDYLQANLVVLPAELTHDFLRFCQYNPKACSLLEILGPGDSEPAEWRPVLISEAMFRDTGSIATAV